MKPVTIPSMYKPFLEVYINGAKRQFPAGQTITVEDDVASIIENAMKNVPARRAPVPPIIPEGGNAGQVLTKTDTGYEWADLPTATATKLGAVKVGASVQISSGKIDVRDATRSKRGIVKMASAVGYATESDIVATFNSLIDSLTSAGILEDALAMTPPPTND